MANKVIVGQPERPNSGQSVSLGGAVESGDKHIQNVADITLMTSTEVTALLSPTLADHETRIASTETLAGHALVESPSGNVVPMGSFAANTLLGRTGSGTIAGRLVSDFANKAAPVAADLLMVSDSQAANALRHITLAQALSLSERSAYVLPPASANAFDDEFNTGSADWAARGYTIVNAAGVTQTRSGDINPWDPTGPAAGTYWSTLIGSWLYTQAPAGVQLDIYKTIALAAGDTFFVRTVGTYYLASGAANRFNEVGLYAASGGALDNNNRVYNTVRDENTGNFLAIDAGRVTAGGFVGTTGRSALGGHDIRGVYYASGTTHRLLLLDSQTGEVKTLEVAGTPAAAALTRFGIRNVFSNTTGTVPQIWGVDFIRRKTSNAWLIP